MVASSKRSFLDRCFHDKDGRFVVLQFPNAPLLVWIAATLVGRFVDGKLGDLLSLISFGALFTWAWLEIFQGSSYARRFLGAVIMVATVWQRL